MRKDLLAYIVLLVVGLGSAYYVSLPVNEKSSEQTDWIRIDPKAISEINFISPSSTVSITRGATSGFFAKTNQVDETIPCDKTKEKCEEKRSEDSFKLSKKFDDALTSFNPLYVLRSLGKADKMDLSEFGLKDPAGSLEIKAGGKTLLNFSIGKKSFGSRNIFVVDKEKNEVLLMAGDSIEDIEKAKSRLIQRDLFDIEFDTVTGAKIVAGDVSKELKQSKKDGSGDLIWTEGKDLQGKPAYKNFMDQVAKLNAQKYASEDELKTLNTLAPIVSITLSKNETPLDTIKLVKQSEGAETKYWAQTEFLGTYVQINSPRAEGLEKDLPVVFGK